MKSSVKIIFKKHALGVLSLGNILLVIIIIWLLFKQSPELLGDSLSIAKRRFLALENKLNTQPEFKMLYYDVMEDYLNVGHMKIC